VHGLGEVYLFTDPDGHELGLYWDVEWYRPTTTDRPALKNQAAAYPGRGRERAPARPRQLPDRRRAEANRGLPARRAGRAVHRADRQGRRQPAGHLVRRSATRPTTSSTPRTGPAPAAACTTSPSPPTPARRSSAADVCLDAGVHIETGPHKHAIQQTFFLYVWEPGGNRIEICNAGARLVLAPDWQTISWTARSGPRARRSSTATVTTRPRRPRTPPGGRPSRRRSGRAGEAPPPYPTISDDEIRESIEGSQLRLMRERGVDLTVFSPRASAMGHHFGDEAVSAAWTRACNDLIAGRRLYPDNFVGVCQLPQSPGVPIANSIAELRRCVEELGFVGCNLNPDPSGGHWSGFRTSSGCWAIPPTCRDAAGSW
jgi:hypothetical protein